MKRFFCAVVAAGLLMAGSVTNSVATTISYSEVFRPGQPLLMNSGGTGLNQVQWSFDLRDNAGWNIPNQVFSNGNIRMLVQDDGGNGDGSEKATFTFESGVGSFEANINSSVWAGIFSVDSSAFSDGIITATLTATLGDFYFHGAELNVESNYAENPVPEPSTLMLLGAGLSGLAIWRKRKQVMPLQ